MSDYNQNENNDLEQFDTKDPFEEALKKTSNYSTSPVRKTNKKSTSNTKPRKLRKKGEPRPIWQVLLITLAILICIPLVYGILLFIIPDDSLATKLYFGICFILLIFIGFKSKSNNNHFKW